MPVHGSHDVWGERESLPGSVEQFSLQAMKSIDYVKVMLRELQSLGLAIKLDGGNQVFQMIIGF